MSLSFDATFYQGQRPDVYNAFINTAGSTGLTWAAFAQQHYNTFGRFEGSDPSGSFSTSYYLTTYPDVAAAGVNPFDHFLAFGSLENRVPFDGFPTSSFVPATYAAANPDLAAAGITSDAALYQHFVLYGQFEGRSGTPTVTTPGSGSTFTLTTSIDNVTGTTGDDTIIGDAGSTSVADQIDGGVGTDTLKLFGTNTNPAHTNVEIVELNAPGGNFSVANNSSVQTLKLVDSTATRTLTIANGQAVSLENTTGGANIVSADATTVGLTVNKVGTTAAAQAVDIQGATITALNVTSATNSSNITLNNSVGGKLATLTVAGDKLVAVDADTNAVTLTTVDASSSTGGVTVVLDDAATAKDVTFTGGTGNDAVFFGAAFDVNDTATGGAGTDTIGIADGGDLTAASGAKATGFEILDIAGAAASTYDLDFLSGITNVKISAATTGAVVLNDLAVGTSVTVGAAINAGGIDINQKDAGAGSPDDTITVNFDASAALATTGNIDVNDIETVNLTSTSSGTSITHVVTSLDAEEATSVTVNASTAALTIGALNASAAVLIDATASAKAVSITSTDTFGAAGGVAIKGGAGDDVLNFVGATVTANKLFFTGGAGADTMQGFAASTDTFVYTAATDSTLAKTDEIGAAGTGSEFDTTVDKIDLSAFTFTANQKAAIFSQAAKATGDTADYFNNSGTDRAVAYHDDGTDTFVYVDLDGNGDFNATGDLVIKLDGVTGAEVPVLGDFVF